MFSKPTVQTFDYNHTSGIKMCGGQIMGFRCYRRRWLEAAKVWKDEKEMEEIGHQMKEVRVEECEGEEVIEEAEISLEEISDEEVGMKEVTERTRNEVEGKEQMETQEEVLRRLRKSDNKRRKLKERYEKKILEKYEKY